MAAVLAESHVTASRSGRQQRSAYRKKAAQFHPDRNPEPDAASKFRAVQEAYEVLADLDRRKVYDETRRSSLIDDPLVVAREIWSSHLGNMQT